MAPIDSTSLIFGLFLVAAVLTACVAFLHHRRVMIESQLRARIAELQESKKRWEEVLSRRTALLTSLLNSIPDRVFFKDRSGTYLGCNPEFGRYVGRPLDEIVGKTDHDFFPKEQADSFRESDRITMEGGEAWRKEASIEYADGRRLLVERLKAPLRSADGAVIGVVGVSRDITERKEAEERLKESEESARRLAQEDAAMAEIGRVINSTLKIEDVYEQFSNIVGDLLPFDMLWVSTNHPEDQSTIRISYVAGLELPDRHQGDVIPSRGSIHEEIMRTRSSFLAEIEDEQEWRERFPPFASIVKMGTRSILAVPLFSKDEVIAVLHFWSLQPHAYTVEHLRLAGKVGQQIAGAVANAQLFIERTRAEERAKSLAQERSIMMETGRIIGSTLHIEEVYERFAEEVRKLISFDRIVISLIDYSHNVFSPAYVAGAGLGRYSPGTILPLAGSVNEAMSHSRSGLLFHIENEEEIADRFPVLLLPFREGFRSMLFVPLISNGEVIGGLNFQTKKSNVYSESNLDLAQRVADQIAGAIANSQLFAELKEAERARRESEERWQFALEGAGEGVWDWNVQSNKSYFSPQWKAILGLEDNEIGDTIDEWVQRVHPDDQLRVSAEIYKHFRGETPVYTSEHRVRCKDGGYKWILDRGKIITRTQDGQPLRMIGTHADITERRKSEEALRLHNEEVAQERRNLQLIFDSVQMALLLIDADGDITRVNDRFAALVGRPAEEILMHHPGEALSCVNVGLNDHRCGETPMCGSCPIREILTRVLKENTSVSGVEVNKHLMKGGEVRDLWLNVSGTLVVLDGSPHVLLSMMDITHRKTMELSLGQAKEAAEAADRAKSEFLANMSHEIRTPMNGVIGMTGLLLDTDLTPEQRQYAEIVRSSGESLLSLINDILDFSKIEARKMELEEMEFDLRTTLEDITEMLAVKAQEKGLEIVCMISPETPSWLRGDPGRLRQILVNLIGNAIKFTHRGGVTIRAGIDSEDEGSALLRFTVSDTGIGIPEDKRAILFSPFTQVDGSITRKYGGTGLGLAISRQLAGMMGGEIGVESDEGKGSTFWVTAAFKKQRFPDAYQPQPLADLKGLKALVVDDHETNRVLVTALLKSWGCHPVEAANGETALGLLLRACRDRDPFHIALVDNVMPDLDGAELGRRIKEDQEICSTRLVMMTSLGQRGDAAQMGRIGFSGYLTKPLRQAHLRECLALVMGRQETMNEKAAHTLVTRHTVTESLKHRTRILLAEDNKTNQLVTVKILEKLGYRADAVADGRNAVNALRRVAYDLVLMDCQMPEMDGFEATRRIRSGEAGTLNPDVPIVAITAHAMKGDRERCLEAGMTDYLSKPIQPEELRDMLDRWLGKTFDERDGVLSHGTSRGTKPEQTDEAPDTSAAGRAIFDRDDFLGRIMGDLDLAQTLVDGFLADMPVQIDFLEEAIAAGDGSLAGQQAHRIKGAASNMGGAALQKAAFSMELAGKEGDLNKLRILLPELQRQFAQLKSALEKRQSA